MITHDTVDFWIRCELHVAVRFHLNTVDNQWGEDDCMSISPEHIAYSETVHRIIITMYYVVFLIFFAGDNFPHAVRS